MATSNFKFKSFDNLVEDVKKLREFATKLKTALVSINIGTANKSDVMDASNRFNTYINNLLIGWEIYGDEMQDVMKAAEVKKDVSSTFVEYDEIKDYVYAKYDYASILQFAEGLIQGINDEVFKENNGFKDFFESTVSKAFDDISLTTAGVVENVSDLITGMTHGKIDDFESRMFKSIANNNHLFDSRTRIELYKAINKTIEFVVINLTNNTIENHAEAAIVVSFINYVIEYAVFSIAAYMARINAISIYAAPFVKSNNSSYDPYDENISHFDDREVVVPAKINESVDNTSMPEISSSEITIMKNVEDIVAKDVNKAEEFFNDFSAFITMIGGDALFTNNFKPEFPTANRYPLEKDSQNAFMGKLRDNALYKFITTSGNSCHTYVSAYKDDVYIDGLRSTIKSLITSSPIQGKASSKQDMLYCIKAITCDDTCDAYRRLATDLYFVAVIIGTNLFHMIKDCGRIIEKQGDENPSRYIFVKSTASECLHMLNELYGELMGAFSQRARDIEIHINDLNRKRDAEINDMLTIKIPGMKSDVCSDCNMMSSVPNTTKISADIMDLYVNPIKESAELYFECLKMLPEFKDDMYFQEALDAANIWEKFKSWIKGLFEKISRFWNGQRIKKAQQWVEDNAVNIHNIDYSTVPAVNTKPFKDTIDPTVGFNKIITELNNYRSDMKFETEESVKKYLEKFYPSQEVMKFYRDDNMKADGDKYYMNYILFDDNPPTKDEHVTKAFSGEELKKVVTSAVDNVANSKATFDKLTQYNNQINAALTKFQNNITQAKTQIVRASEKSTNGQTASNQVNAKVTDNQRLNRLNMLEQGVQNIIMKVWGISNNALIEYTMESWKVLQTVMKSAKPNPSTNNEEEIM